MTTSFQLRVSLSDPAAPGAILLDWTDDQRGTIEVTRSLLADLQPLSMAMELLRCAGAIYCIDKVVLRGEAQDGWTRDLALDVPALDPDVWRLAIPAMTEAVSFLSGDRWTFTVRATNEAQEGAKATQPVDAVCLFSGGLDSLAGAIDLLEDGATVCLVGHHEGGLAPGRQRELAAALRQAYGAGSVRLRQLYLRPAPPNHLQAQPLPNTVREITTRARSLLFISAGLAVATAMGPEVPLYVPENGFIGINVPLTAARSGSLSTRTTHPYFHDRLREALDSLGISNRIQNPFRLRTKGEAIQASRNPGLLADLAPRSLSCAHPEAVRWTKLKQGNCGYCYPCVIRRAAMHRAGLDAGAGYAFDVLTAPGFIEEVSDRAVTLRALVQSLQRRTRWTDVLRNGPIPGDERADFDAVYKRGREEIFAWVQTTTDAALRGRLPSSLS